MNQERIKERYKLNELVDVLDYVEETIADSVNNNYGPFDNDRDYLNALLFTLGKGLVSLREIIILCFNGFPDGALSISRNLYEQFILTEYLSEKKGSDLLKTLLQRYKDDYSVKRAEALIFYHSNIVKDEKEVSEQKRILTDIQEKYKLTEKPRSYWWANKNTFSDIYTEVLEFQTDDALKFIIRFMHLIYKRASLSLHASYIGNTIRLGSSIDGIDTGPWENGHESALYLATTSMIHVIGRIYDYLGIEWNEVIDRMNGLSIYYMDLINEQSMS